MSHLSAYRPVIVSLLTSLTAAGFTLDGVDDGGEYQQTSDPGELTDAILSVVESTLRVKTPAGDTRWIYLVLGLAPDEIVSDWTLCPLLDPVLEAWANEWEGKELPPPPPPTPSAGPWRVGDAGATVFGPVNGNPSPETIADVRKPANARLIAAAPELLAALTAVMRHPHIRAYLPYDYSDPVFLAAMAAIRKATNHLKP